jgi:hypothetical protein
LARPWPDAEINIPAHLKRRIPPKDQSELKYAILAQSRRIQESTDRVQKYFEHEPIRNAP